MKQPTLLLTLFLFAAPLTQSNANVAQPGLYRAGGTGSFSLLYPSDSTAFKKVRMLRESVRIELFDGFAAVKGTYWMKNASSDTVQLRTGYPVHSLYESTKNGDRTDILFDELYKLKVFTDGRSKELSQKTLSAPQSRSLSERDWYVWSNRFAPADTHKIELYFLVKTKGAMIIDGYKKEHLNGFVYLLESASTWKQPIGKGRIRIRLSDSLKLEDIRGASPDSMLEWYPKSKDMLMDFQELSPGPADNIVLSYRSERKALDFASIADRAEHYFERLDRMKPPRGASKAVGWGSPFRSTKKGPDHSAPLLRPRVIGSIVLGVILLFFLGWFLKRRRG